MQRPQRRMIKKTKGKNPLFFSASLHFTKESIIDKTYPPQISPTPSLKKREIPPFCKGRKGGISGQFWLFHHYYFLLPFTIIILLCVLRDLCG